MSAAASEATVTPPLARGVGLEVLEHFEDAEQQRG